MIPFQSLLVFLLSPCTPLSTSLVTPSSLLTLAVHLHELFPMFTFCSVFPSCMRLPVIMHTPLSGCLMQHTFLPIPLFSHSHCTDFLVRRTSSRSSALTFLLLWVPLFSCIALTFRLIRCGHHSFIHAFLPPSLSLFMSYPTGIHFIYFVINGLLLHVIITY